MKTALFAALAVAALTAAQDARTFVGVLSDDVCARGDHTQMRMGPTDAECTIACVSAHGAAYVLYDGTTAYELSGLREPEAFAGRKVRVVGALDEKKGSIRVESIALAK